MFWKEYMDEVVTELHSFAPNLALTMRGTFRALTIAQNELQKITGAVRRSMDIALSTMSSDGVLPIPTSDTVRALDRAEIIQVGQTDPSYEYTVVDMEAYLYAKRNSVQFVSTKSPAIVTLDYTNQNILVYPFAGLQGTLRIHYQPALKAFAPSETLAWPGYQADLSSKITANGPEVIFDVNAQRALICKAKMYLVTRIPGGRDEFHSEIAEWEMEWLAGIEAVEDANPSYGMTSSEGGYFVAVK